MWDMIVCRRMLRRRHGWISALWGLRIAVEWGVFPHFILCFVLLFCWCCCYCWWCRLSSSSSSSLSYKVNKNFISQSIFPLSFCSRFWCHFRLSNNTPHFDNIKVEYKRNSLDFFFFFFCCRSLPRRHTDVHIPAAVSISPIRNNWPTKTFSGKESGVDRACECYTVAPISSVPYRGSKKKTLISREFIWEEENDTSTKDIFYHTHSFRSIFSSSSSESSSFLPTQPYWTILLSGGTAKFVDVFIFRWRCAFPSTKKSAPLYGADEVEDYLRAQFFHIHIFSANIIILQRTNQRVCRAAHAVLWNIDKNVKAISRSWRKKRVKNEWALATGLFPSFIIHFCVAEERLLRLFFLFHVLFGWRRCHIVPWFIRLTFKEAETSSLAELWLSIMTLTRVSAKK